jgi:hypothetical protein
MTKGNYYKRKTKDFFVKQGYVVEYMEKLQRIVTTGEDKKGKEKKQKLIWVKKDLFASDLLAIGNGEVIFIQVKSGNKTTGINIKKAVEEFNRYPFPDFVKRYIVVWRERQRDPEIIDTFEVE